MSAAQPDAQPEVQPAPDRSPIDSALGRAGLPQLLIALAALLAVLPLRLHGWSCGHDFDFHLRSWMDAAAQWQALGHGGVLRPVWAFHPAWNAGEPRLLFYPPLSWMLGGLLTVLLPWSIVYIAFTWVALAISGFTMHRLLRRWMSPAAATLGGCLYLANPYMLYCAYARTAYAELLAAAWSPLLIAALFRKKPSPWRIAVALALLWLSNAPAAIVGSYSVLFLGIGLLIAQREEGLQHALRTCALVTGGVVAGLLIDAFYIVPLAVERRYVQLNLALWPQARPEANFLFEYNTDWFHDLVLKQVSWIGISLVAASAICAIAWLLLQRRRAVRAFNSMHDRDTTTTKPALPVRDAVIVLLGYSIFVLYLLSHWSGRWWHIGPQLVFLQFPWRFLAMQGAVTTAIVAIFLSRITARLRPWTLPVAGILIALLAGWFGADRGFREGCEDGEDIFVQRAAFLANKGFEEPTDEYTAVGADNDKLSTDLPPSWLGASAQYTPPGDGQLKASDPHPAEHDRRIDDRSFTITASSPGSFLMVRLRNFPGWHILLDGSPITAPPHRPDGLIAVPLTTAGTHTVEVRYRKPADQWIGGAISLVAITGLVFTTRRRKPQAPLS